MNRRRVFLMPLGALAPVRLLANPANGDPRLQKLFATFVAPCCWRENLITHHSPAADEMRADIRRRIEAGATDSESKNSYLQQYSTRIPAVPDGTRGRLLTCTPVIASAAGLASVTLLVRRMKSMPHPPAPSGELPDLLWEWDTPEPASKQGESK